MNEHRPPRIYGREKSRLMRERMERTMARNVRARMEEARRRLTDPFEQAKLRLQQRGFKVYAHAVLNPKSKLVVVGTRLMTRDEVIDFAEQFSPPKLWGGG